MTKSTKFDARQSGESLFQSHAEGGTFDKYYYRKPIENITNALEKNKQIEQQSGRHTRDQVLENMQVEAQQGLVDTQYDFAVQELNRKYNLDQWTQFSKAAGELITTWAEHKKEKDIESGYLAISKLRLTNPDLYERYIKEWDTVRSESTKANVELKGESLKAALEAHDLELAETLLEASGWEKKTIIEATLADRMHHAGYFYQQNKAKAKFSFPELGIENMTYDEWSATNPNLKAGTEEGKKNQLINSKFISGCLVNVRKDHFIKQGFSAEIIATKVDPVLDQLRSQEAHHQLEKKEKVVKNTVKENQERETKNAILLGLGLGGNATAQQLWTNVDNDWKQYPGKTEKEKRANSFEEKLGIILSLREERTPGISSIELHQLANGRIYGGTEAGQHRGLAKGSSKELQELYEDVFTRTDFWGRLKRQEMKEGNFKKDNIENAMKMAEESVREQVKLKGPLTEIEKVEFARSLSERGYGKASDIAKRLEDAVETVQGISNYKWAERFKADKRNSGGKLHREDYPLGIPPEVFTQEGVKDLFHSDPKYHIPISDQRSLKEKFGKAVAAESNEKDAIKLGAGEYTDAGINAYRAFKGYYDDIIGKDINVSPESARTQALIQTNKHIKENYKDLMVEPDDLTKLEKSVDEHKTQLSGTATGRPDEVVLKGFEDRMEWAKKRVETYRKNGYKGSIENLFQGDLMYQPEDGSPPVKFRDDLWTSTAAMAGGDTLLLKSQLKAMEIKDNAKFQLPSDVKNYDINKGRVSPFLKPLPKEVSNKLSMIGPLPNVIGLDFNRINPAAFTQSLGFSEEYLADNIKGIDALQQFKNEVLKKCGLKPSDICSEEVLQSIRERMFKIYPDRFDLGIDWSEYQFSGWNTIMGLGGNN